MQNDEQFDYWNGPEGQHWVDRDTLFDVMLAPFVEPVLDVAAIAGADRVLDVGCGNGATSRAAARARRERSGRRRRHLGADARPGTRRAVEEGAGNVEFVHADAQDHDFGAESGIFDVMISRFGVMFFADPIAAFANLARALRPGGRVAFVCWQSLFANQWVAVPAAALLPDRRPARPAAAARRARPVRVRRPRSRAIDPRRARASRRSSSTICTSPSSLVVDSRSTTPSRSSAKAGWASACSATSTRPTRDRALAAVRDALEPFTTADGVRLDSAAWLVQASR